MTYIYICLACLAVFLLWWFKEQNDLINSTPTTADDRNGQRLDEVG